MQICFATNNLNKIKEVSKAVPDNFNIISLKELSVTEELPETQNTFHGNALQKALYVFEKTNTPCFADDSGLEVEALNGEPGVFSARYAGPQRSDADNIAKLLQQLSTKENRTARFKTVFALVGFGDPQFFVGEVSGIITTEKKGSQGFGYDPVFQPDGFANTFAEMTIEEKNKLSHRGKAVEKLVRYLQSL